MRIGILLCDTVRSSLASEFGEYPEMIEAGLAEPDNDFEFVTYLAYEGILPECVEECDAYIITGSHYSVFDDELLWIHSLLNFVVRLNKAKVKTIGICFGHQIIAEAMGGKVERADCGWLVGVHKVSVTKSADFMNPAVDSFQIAMMSEDQVQEVGEQAVVLGSSPSCEYALLQYEDHMLSTQGRPEFSPLFAQGLLSVCQEEFPSKRYEVGYKSLSEKKLDSDLFFQWLRNFLVAGQDTGEKRLNI